VPLAKSELEAEVRRLGPFHHEVSLPHGLTTQPEGLNKRPGELVRMRDILLQAWPAMLERCGGSLAGRRVLDVGCNCGGFSVRAAQDGAEHVLGIDVVDHYIEQADFIGRALELEQVEFSRLPVESLDPDELGSFDVTLCFGLLYHLENPVLAMKRIAAVTDRLMVVDTNLDRAGPPGPYWRMQVAPAADAASESSTTALWRTEEAVCQFMPTADGVVELMRFLGFAEVVRLDPREGQSDRYHRGSRATFIAARAHA
jgi:tRNA (mo5U34)-methyltransferase